MKKRKTTRRVSMRQERQVMDKLGGRVQPASGSLPGYKGDGRVFDQHRVEMKYTVADSFSLKLRELWKIAGECEGRERPLFIIDFKEKATHKLRGRYAVIPFAELERLLHAATDNS